jgi:hypothetical protein
MAVILIGCSGANFSKDEIPSEGGQNASPTPTPNPTATPNPTGTPEPTPVGGCPGVIPDPEGCLVAKCKGGINNPRVEITWCQNPLANSNSLQKGDMYPDDPGSFWGWLYQDPNETPPYDTYSFTDTNVLAGSTYWYRAKFRPELPSNVSFVAMPIDECTCRDP